MSFQTYLLNIQRLTKQTPEQIKAKAEADHVLTPTLKATEFVRWLGDEYQLGRGHAMALWKLFLEKGWIQPKAKSAKTQHQSQRITIHVSVNRPIEFVWEHWTKPKHIVHWNFASQDWCTKTALNQLKVGGQFNFRMEAVDGSEGFDFTGTHQLIRPLQSIQSTLEDGRSWVVNFHPIGKKTKVTEIFEVEKMHPVTQQRQGWQSILNQFKRYCERKTDHP